MDGWKRSWMSCLEYVWPAEQNLAHPHFERIELRPEIIMVTFDLNKEQIFKVIGFPVAKKQFETHVGYI